MNTTEIVTYGPNVLFDRLVIDQSGFVTPSGVARRFLAGRSALRDRAVVTANILRGANLGYANLRGADLGYADLGGANLWGANLGHAEALTCCEGQP